MYTTLDQNLQRDATEAVRIGMEEVDQRIKHRKKRDPRYPDPQCALIAMDPHDRGSAGADRRAELRVQPAQPDTGKTAARIVIQAICLCGGAEHGALGRKSGAYSGDDGPDEPTTFWFDGKPYEPSNFEHKFYGNVSLRDAMAHSLNVATVKVAEETGYDAVVDLARRAGLNMDIQPTPAVALGSYEVTPLEIAGAYTIYANKGTYSKPYFLGSILSDRGSNIFDEHAGA